MPVAIILRASIAACPPMKRFFERLHQGHHTLAWPKAPAKLHLRFRGLPTADQGKCQAACSACSDACPTGAINTGPLRIDLGKCLFCPVCTEACPTGAVGFTNDFRLGASTRQALVTTGKDSKTSMIFSMPLLRTLEFEMSAPTVGMHASKNGRSAS
jgi:formate hydrogenlyase subunit 6/NADH:ubiquinone oxidoreductase subunit I